MKKYNILWIDDEWEKQDSFLTLAEQENIEITPFKTSFEGMDALEKDIFLWDGVILDAKVYDKSENETASTIGMHRSIHRLKELSSKRLIPWFVFTGQPDLQSNSYFSESLAGKKYYSKSNDQLKLINDIKKQADLLLETQIRHKFSNVFGIIDDNDLLKLLLALENNDCNNSNHFPLLRKLLEDTYKIIQNIGLIPPEINKTNKQSDFLRQEALSKYIPNYIQGNMRSLANTTNDGSHRLIVDNDVKLGKAPYLLHCTAFQLLSILYWLNNFRKSDYDKEELRTLIETIGSNSTIKNTVLDEEDSITYILEKDLQDNYHCGNYLFQYNKGPDFIGKEIRITNFTENTKSSKNKYPFFILNFVVIE